MQINRGTQPQSGARTKENKRVSSTHNLQIGDDDFPSSLSNYNRVISYPIPSRLSLHPDRADRLTNDGSARAKNARSAGRAAKTSQTMSDSSGG